MRRRRFRAPLVPALVVAALTILAPSRLSAAAPDQGASGSATHRATPSDDWRLQVDGGRLPGGLTVRSTSSVSPRTTFASTCIGGRNPGAACSSDSDCPGACAGGKVPGQSCFGDGGLNCQGACSPSHEPCQTHEDCNNFPGGGKCTAPAPGTCTSPAPGVCHCDDVNPCTDDVNDAVQGCVFTPNTAPCNDGTACTQGDVCSGGQCTGSPIQCFDDNDPCTAEYCNPISACQSVPVTQIDVSGAHFTSLTRLTWTYTFPVSSYNVYRGTIPTGGFGSRLPAPPVYDQTCFERDDEHGDGLTISIDAASPINGTAFYYLVAVRQYNCGEGSLGRNSSGTSIPNVNPCPP